jgi:hypothetical protein
LCTYIFIHIFYDSSETSLHLWVKMYFGFIYNNQSFSKVISIHSKNHGQ